jgi:hypothetical protein
MLEDHKSLKKELTELVDKANVIMEETAEKHKLTFLDRLKADTLCVTVDDFGQAAQTYEREHGYSHWNQVAFANGLFDADDIGFTACIALSRKYNRKFEYVTCKYEHEEHGDVSNHIVVTDGDKFYTYWWLTNDSCDFDELNDEEDMELRLCRPYYNLDIEWL